MSEIIIATKEVNAKTRNAAYELLVTIARAAENPDLGGSEQALVRFFGVIVGGLAGRTPHMVSIRNFPKFVKAPLRHGPFSNQLLRFLWKEKEALTGSFKHIVGSSAGFCWGKSPLLQARDVCFVGGLSGRLLF